MTPSFRWQPTDMIRTAELRNAFFPKANSWSASPRRQMSSVQFEDESKLVEQARAGSHPAFAELVRRHHRIVRVFVGRYLRDESEVDEISQRAFIEAYRALGRFRGQSSFQSWLIAIAKRQAAMFVRGETRRRKRETTAGELALLKWNESEKEGHDQDQLDHLSKCLQQLPSGSHSLVTRFYFERQSIQCIAEGLERSPGAIRMQLMRIRKALAECITQRAGSNG